MALLHSCFHILSWHYSYWHILLYHIHRFKCNCSDLVTVSSLFIRARLIGTMAMQ